MQPLLRVILFVGLLVGLAAAVPAAGHIQKRTFKVERVRNPNFKGYDGPRQLLKTYRKFRMPVPAELLDAIQKQNAGVGKAAKGKGKGKGKKGKGAGAGTGAGAGAAAATGTSTSTGATQSSNSGASSGASGNGTTSAAAGRNNTAGVGLVTTTPEAGDVEYLSPVQIGGQTLNLDFDSGSSDLWIFNTQLAAASTTGHQVFDPSKSKTFKMVQGASFSISYGDGSGAAGNVGTDTVNIGGATVTGQAIELATAVSQSFVQDTANNGLVGLAFSKLNTVKPQQQKTFFDNVKTSLAEPLFTADLRKNAVGAYEFGRIDTTKFTGQMAWIPVNTSQGFWQFGTGAFAVGTGQPIKTAAAQAIADTGTTLILSSPDVVNGYYAQVQGATNDAQVGGFTVPCNAQLPDLILDVNGQYAARVKGSDINFAQVQGNTCFGGLQATTSPLQIWGDIFFKSQFVVFNGNNSLGMAQHV